MLMNVPWMRIVNAVIGVNDVARVLRGRAAATADQDQLAPSARMGPIEARLAGVVVAALKEAFERDHQRLELEREQIEAERQRAERALRLELGRQAADREIGRLRLLAALAVAGWLGTLFFASSLIQASLGARVALGVGWALLLGALGASFAAQSAVARSLDRLEPGSSAIATVSGGLAASSAPWLIVAGLGIIGFGVLLA
jgi:hypothetical protein